MKQVGTKLCSNWLCDIAALSDGRLAVASGFNNLEVLNLNSAPEQGGDIELTGHKRPVMCVKELRDKRLVSCSDDNTLKIWDLEQNPGKECVTTLEGHSDTVNCVAELPDGRLISGSDDQTLRVWNLRKPEGKQYEFSLEGNDWSTLPLSVTKWIGGLRRSQCRDNNLGLERSLQTEVHRQLDPPTPKR